MSAQPNSPKLRVRLSPLWVTVGLLALLAALALVLSRDHEDPAEPRVLSSSGQGQHLLLPAEPEGNWQADFVVASGDKRERVLQALAEVRARYKQVRPEIRVWAEPGLMSRERLALQLARSLAQLNLGQQVEGVTPPAFASELPGALVLRCRAADQKIARALLGALAPYLSGRVYLMFDESTAAHQMQLYLLGKPWFDERGLATFDPQTATAGD